MENKLRVYTVPELSALLRVSELTIRRKILSGQLQGRKTGRQYLVTESSLNEYLNRPVSEPLPIKTAKVKDTRVDNRVGEIELIELEPYEPQNERGILTLSFNRYRRYCKVHNLIFEQPAVITYIRGKRAGKDVLILKYFRSTGGQYYNSFIGWNVVERLEKGLV